MSSSEILTQLLSNNAEWAAEVTTKDPHFHEDQARGPQEPNVCLAFLKMHPMLTILSSGSLDRMLRLASPRCSDHKVKSRRSVRSHEYCKVSDCFNYFNEDK